jgi:TonB-dependent SusC/RagA subfamily outer membrane receptor
MKSKILFFLVLSFISVCFAQSNSKKISIDGVVVDLHNRPVPGAKITIDGIQTGESTNSKGFYKIKIKPTAEKIGIYTLPPSSIEESINARTSIDFILNDSIIQQIYNQKDLLGEEEVNVGYGSQKRKNSTTSAGNMNENKNKQVTYLSIYDMIQNTVPGVTVVGTSVILRGASSISLDTEALFVVNGTPVMSIDNIRPQEVKSIDVLKGAAASIYGSRGANGVILITLKN